MIHFSPNYCVYIQWYSPSSHLPPPKNARVAELAMGQLLRSGGFPNGFPHKYDLDITIGPWLGGISLRATYIMDSASIFSSRGLIIVLKT